MFDTISKASAMGSFRHMAKDITPSEMVPNEEDELESEDSSAYDFQLSYNSSTTTRGSALMAIGPNSDAAHSTLVIKPPSDERDIQALLVDNASSEHVGSLEEPTTPPQQEPPPAYSGSTRSSRRTSYAARTNTNGRGTVMREADLGSGIDTIRPVKKVDAAGSLRMSSEYVGSMREGSTGSPPSSPSKEGMSPHKRNRSEAVKAGLSVVDDVILPTCERVRVSWSICITVVLAHVISRLSEMIWTHERLNP
jgi:serine/threonine-protein kinase 24/25/MST4